MEGKIHLANLDAIYSNIIIFKGNYNNKSKVILKKYTELEFPYFDILFEDAVDYLNPSRDYLSFSIYKDHKDITKNKSVSSFIDKELLYIYFKKEKAYQIDYNTLYTLFYLNNITNKDKKNDKRIEIPFESFYNFIKKTLDIKDITYLVKLIKAEKRKSQINENNFKRDKELIKIFNNGGI